MRKSLLIYSKSLAWLSSPATVTRSSTHCPCPKSQVHLLQFRSILRASSVLLELGGIYVLMSFHLQLFSKRERLWKEMSYESYLLYLILSDLSIFSHLPSRNFSKVYGNPNLTGTMRFPTLLNRYDTAGLKNWLISTSSKWLDAIQPKALMSLTTSCMYFQTLPKTHTQLQLIYAKNMKVASSLAA